MQKAKLQPSSKGKILVSLGLSGLLAACSSAPEGPVVCHDGICTIAPKRATSRPYTIKGITYYPQAHYEYDEVGIASYYGGGDIFHGRPTATGERFDMNEVTAAHKTLPLPCVAIVTNLENGREIEVKVNDRGPFIAGRIIDCSRRVAQLLGFEGKGTAKVRVRTLVAESLALNGLDPSQVMFAEANPCGGQEVLPLEVPGVVAPNLPKLPDSLFDGVEAAEAPAPLPAATPMQQSAPYSSGIFVEVGRYNDSYDAQNLLNSLKRLTETEAASHKCDGEDTYTVRLGPLPSMIEANQVLDLLTDAGHVMSRIVIHQ